MSLMRCSEIRDSVRGVALRAKRRIRVWNSAVCKRIDSILSSHRWVVLMLALCAATNAPAQETYYVIIFSTQQAQPTPKYSHTFATFIRVMPCCAAAGACCVESHTISWMPASLQIRIHALLPEKGVNLELDPSFRWAVETGQRISMWGPYQIKPELYRRAMEQLCRLKAGRVRYKAVDTGYFTGIASNCIHGVSSSVGGTKVHVTSPNYGETASYYVLQRMRRWVINPDCKHEWLVSALGLNCYPIIHREWENPRTGMFWTAFRDRFGFPPPPAGWIHCEGGSGR